MVNKVIKKLLLVLVILFAAEIASYLDFFGLQISQKDKLTLPYSYKPIPFEQRYEEAKELGFGKILGAEKKGKPIVLCISSDAFGDGLEEKDTFGKKISEEYDVPVYLRSFSGWGMQNMYWQFIRDDFYREVPEPQAVIVIYNPYIGYFTYAPDVYNTLRYNIKNGKFVRVSDKIMFLNYSYTISKINRIIADSRCKNIPNTLSEFSTYLLECKKQSKKHWKNTKFIVVKNIDKQTPDEPEYWENLASEGIVSIELSDSLGANYASKSKYKKSNVNNHPSPKIWQKAVPTLEKYIVKGQK